MNNLRQAGRLLWDAAARFNRNDGWSMAGFIAFTNILSLFPFLIFAAALFGNLIGPERTDDILHALFEIVPSHVALTLEPVVDEVLSERGGGLLTVSGLFAIWVASNAVEAFRTAFDRAYRVSDPRGLIVGRLIAIGFVFLGAVVSALLGISVLLSPLIIRVLTEFFGFAIPGIAGWLSYLFGLIVFFSFLMVMHRYLPGERLKMDKLWPGVLLTTGLWTLAATGFSVYLSYSPAYTVTYGALAGVMITLMFFYITGMAIIFGAEFNAAISRAGISPKHELGVE